MSDAKNLTMSDDHEANIKESDELFKQGKKLYIVGDYSKALEYLSKSCKLKELENGPLCDEMFDSYFYLAKGYYMYSKYESDYIGDGLPVGNDGLEEKCESTSDSKALGQIEEGVEEENKDKEDANSDLEDENSKEASKDPNEILTYLQLSYETIECGKLILMRQLTEKKFDESVIELRLADCCDLEGNIYMEEGVIDVAIEEYTNALRLREKHAVNRDADRAIAESHYNLAVALSVDNQPAAAMESYERCKSIMTACRARSLTADGQRDEVAQLDEIIADLDEKIADCRDGARDYELAKESMKQFLSALPVASDAPMSDVTHLLRRRRTDSTDESTLEPANKMPKSSE